MKKLSPIFIIALVVSLTGCLDAMKKQGKIDEQMKNLVMNAPADKVYATAVQVMNSLFVDIKPAGKNTGASSWQVNDTKLGTEKYKEKIRFTIKVSAQGSNKSTLIIGRERSSNLTGNWSKPVTGRFLNYEYKVLQKIDAAKAAEIDKKSSI